MKPEGCGPYCKCVGHHTNLALAAWEQWQKALREATPEKRAEMIRVSGVGFMDQPKGRER